MAHRKRFAMFSPNSRLRDRLTHLETQLKSPGRVFVFVRFESPDLPPYASISPHSRLRRASARTTFSTQ